MSVKFDYNASSFFYSATDWNNVDLSDDSIPLIGDETNKIIRLGTKNIIEAPEKSFKTTFFQRLALGMSVGQTVYSKMPVAQQAHVLYFHGELSPAELAERRNSAIATIPNFTGEHYIEGRSIHAHFITPEGQRDIRKHAMAHRPTNGLPYVITFDPWQEFVRGFDENSFQDMSKATGFLNSLMLETRSTAFIQMHQGKDRTKGARGHSSISGWKDATIRLSRKGDKNLLVSVEPRWAGKFEFGLTFDNGTMIEKNIFTPQTSRVRSLVETAGGKIMKEDFIKIIGGSKDSIRQMIHRAKAEDAIVEDENGDLGLPWNEASWGPPL